MNAILIGVVTMALVLVGSIAGGGWLVALGTAAVALNVASLLRPLAARRAGRPPDDDGGAAPAAPLPWLRLAAPHAPPKTRSGEAAARPPR